jgi:hypothetical protein
MVTSNRRLPPTHSTSAPSHASPQGSRDKTITVYLDAIVWKRSWAGEVRNLSLLVAISVNEEGYPSSRDVT